MPPHERTWRHPSELAAEEHAVARAATPTTTTRVFAFTTGSLGLVAVGLLMIAVTPDRAGSPVAISATTTPVVVDGTIVAMASTAVGPVDRSPIGLRGRPEALATPIGEGRYAVVTDADLTATSSDTGLGAAVQVSVPSGRMLDARIVGRAGEAVLIELERAEPGVELAEERPEGDEVVTVLVEPPITILLDDLPSLSVEEGTAVLDDDGELVGLCSQGGDDETLLLMVTDEMLGAGAGQRDDVSDDPHRNEVDRSDGELTPVGATSGG